MQVGHYSITLGTAKKPCCASGAFSRTVADVAVVDDVVAQAQLLVDHRGQRLDAVGIDRGQLVDPAEDIVEFGDQRVDLGIAHRDARELGDVAHLLGVYGHEGRLAGRPRPFKRRYSNASPTGLPST